jgi:hypothetical protein
VAFGMDVGSENIAIESDVNGDGKTGIAEEIYILQEVSGLILKTHHKTKNAKNLLIS